MNLPYIRKIFFKYWYVCFPAIMIAAFVPFVPALKGGFIWDDAELLFKPLSIGEKPYLFFTGGGLYYRPFLVLSMTLDYYLWHLNAVGYHLTNMVLHVVNSLLVFSVTVHFTREDGFHTTVMDEDQVGSGRYFFPFAAATVFALHPVHVEPVSWISGRADLLSAMFFLLAFLSFMVYKQERRRVALVLTCVFFLFSLWSKENAIALIAIVLLYGSLSSMDRRQLAVSVILLSVVTVIYFYVRKSSFPVSQLLATPGSEGAFFDSGDAGGGFFKVLLFSTGYYFSKLVFPVNLNLMTPRPDNPLYLMFFLICFGGGIALIVWKKKSEFFLFSWIILTLLPALPILFTKVPAPIAERYIYLPSAGFSLLLVLGLSFRSHKRLIIAVLAIFVVYSVITYGRVNVWSSPVRLWKETVRQNPRSVDARINLAAALVAEHEGEKANHELLHALQLDGIGVRQASHIFDLLGSIELESDNYQKANGYFTDAVKLNPDNETALNNFGLSYYRESRALEFDDPRKQELLEQAISYFDKAAVLSPRALMSLYNKAICYLFLGDFEEARINFRSVIDRDPEHELAKKASTFLRIISSQDRGKLIDMLRSAPREM